jgi:hypothetical protein
MAMVSLVVGATGCAGPARNTASNPLLGEPLHLSKRSTDVAIGKLTSGDCTQWDPASSLVDHGVVSADHAEICVSVQRAAAQFAGGRQIRVAAPAVQISTDTGLSPAFVLLPAGQPEFYAYCRIDGSIRAVWTQELAGCTANDELLTSESTHLVINLSAGNRPEVLATWNLNLAHSFTAQLK